MSHCQSQVEQSVNNVHKLSLITGFAPWARQLRPSKQQRQESISSATGLISAGTTTTQIPMHAPILSPPPVQLPLEIWNQIFSWLFPSQLGTIACVSKTWCDLVQRHQLWRNICDTSGLLIRPRSVPSDTLWIPNHFALVQDKADEICEMCFNKYSLCDNRRVLPIEFVDNNNNSSIHLKDSAAVMIQACRSCRIEYYTLHPEPIPKRLDPFTWGDYEVLPRIDAQSAAYIYGLSAFGIRSLRFVNASQPRPSPLEYDSNRLMRLFHEPVVLQYARKIHGGDVGIAALHPDTPRTNWTCSDPKDDAAKQRQMLLRSLLYDKGLTPPPRSIACNTFVQSGHGDPIEIVKELDLENWLQCCTSYSNPYQDGSHQVKLRSNSDRRHQTMTASRPKKEKEDYHRSSHKNDEEGENEDREWYKLLVLDNWLMKRLRDGKFQSYKLDPAGPEKPPESAWPLIDKIDMGHIALVFAAQTIVKFLMTVRVDEGGMEEEYLDKLDMSIDQLKDVLDTSAKKKSLKDDDNSYTLSMLLESELGSGWDRLAIQRAKNLIQSQQM